MPAREGIIIRILVAILICGLTCLHASSAEARRRPRPNFVVIISDDQGSSDLGMFSRTDTFLESRDRLEGRIGLEVETPNIDSLAREGIRINRFYVQPYCLPTRASFHTGALDQAWMFRADPLGGDSIPADTPTISERFQDADYQTILLGKWHLGRAAHAHPNVKGYEHFYGFLGGWIDYYRKTGDTRSEFDWQRNGEPIYGDVGGWAPTQLVDEAIELLDEREEVGDDRPFFLVLSLPTPHGPISAPQQYVDEACEVSSFLCKYRGAINATDVEIGRLLDVLDEYDLSDDTLVMYFSDNGGILNGSGYPFRGKKFQTLEGGIRVGAFARFPGRLRRDFRHPIQVQDLWATFERAARLKRRAPRSSVDRWGALRGKRHARSWRPMYFANRRNDCDGCCCYLALGTMLKSSAVIVGDWKLHRGRGITGPRGNEQTVPGTEFMELYDLRRDPREEVNLLEGRPWMREFLTMMVDWWDPPLESL